MIWSTGYIPAGTVRLRKKCSVSVDGFLGVKKRTREKEYIKADKESQLDCTNSVGRNEHRRLASSFISTSALVVNILH